MASILAPQAGRRPLVQRPVQRFGQQPQGPMSNTLPQRMGQTPTGPLAMNAAQQNQIYNDYSRIGLTPPQLNHIEQGRQTTRYMQGVGGGSTSGINTGNGYYTPDIVSQVPHRQFTPEQAMDQNAQHNNLDSRWAMQYPQGMLQPRGPAPQPDPGASMQTADIPQRTGTAQVALGPDGRKVVIGPNVSPSSLGPRKRIELDTGGAYKNLTPDQLRQNHDDAVANQQQRADLLAAGRNVRANRMYGSPLRPDLFPKGQQAYQSQGPLGAGGLPNGPLTVAQRQAALASIADSPFTQATGFDASTASVDDAFRAFTTSNWAPADQQAFKANIEKRYIADKDFAKEWDARMNRDALDYGVTRPSDNDIAKENQIRALFGKPPIKARHVPLMPPSGMLGPPEGYMPYGAP